MDVLFKRSFLYHAPPRCTVGWIILIVYNIQHIYEMLAVFIETEIHHDSLSDIFIEVLSFLQT
jgi:hypothetical protein